eukprot:11195231-Lingulodinium_polyedra.AAC.1
MVDSTVVLLATLYTGVYGKGLCTVLWSPLQAPAGPPVDSVSPQPGWRPHASNNGDNSIPHLRFLWFCP